MNNSQQHASAFKSRIVYLTFTTLILFSCNTRTDITESDSNALAEDTITNNESNDDILIEEYGNFFVVIADTGTEYYSLHRHMMDISRESGIEIDTMGRFYNQEKNLIALPDNDEDEMYAGDYFPRRFPGQSLSLEYMTSFIPGSGDKTIGLVIGIYEKESEADSIRVKLKPIAPKIFRVQSEIYLGCLH